MREKWRHAGAPQPPQGGCLEEHQDERGAEGGLAAQQDLSWQRSAIDPFGSEGPPPKLQQSKTP